MPKGSRPSLGIALIARDAAHTLPACLKSIRSIAEQIVVCVDERTTDKTAKIARSNGAEVYPVKVSDWHECQSHGRIMAQHFADARNESFKHLDPNLTWWAWIDADDILKGTEELPAVLDALPPDVVGTWAPYHYATMNNGGVTSTLFHRERFLRAAVGWKWEYRVHEVVTPQRPGPWVKADQVAFYHQEGQHRSEESAPRNLLLLEIDYEEDPACSRTLFYLGNQYFAMNKWRESAYWYEQLAKLHVQRRDAVNAYELWQAHCYRSMAYERLGNAEGALSAAFDALDIVPGHPEPYFRLATIYSQAGEPDKAIFWTNLGRQMSEPPFFVFKNPLDYTFNHHMAMADSLAQLGRVAEARGELETALQAYQDPHIVEGVEHYRGIERTSEHARRFKEWAGYTVDAGNGHDAFPAEGAVVARYYDLPREVRSVQSVRDLVVPTMLKRRPNTQPRIVFWCGRSYEEWAPPKLNETGIGGSETAVIEIGRRFAKAGWRVDVYNGAGSYEGEYEGVGYWDPERSPGGEACQMFVSWRQPQLSKIIGADHTALWAHDLNYGPASPFTYPLFDKVLGVSQWHAGMLRQYYDLAPEQVDYVPNGINLDRFAQKDCGYESLPDEPGRRCRLLAGHDGNHSEAPAGHWIRKPWQAIYASSPDRGLMQLLVLWRKIAEAEPGAKLLVAYGWDNIDKAIQSGRRDLADFKNACQRMMDNTPGVEFLGRVPQDRLAELYSESTAWLYPTSFLEVSCISAMEAIAGGAVPVTSASGALPETIGNAGVILPGQPHSFPWQDNYVLTARGVLMDPGAQEVYRKAALDRAKLLTWDHAFERWESIVDGLLSPKKELVAA